MVVRLGAGSAGFVQGGTKDAHIPVLGNLRPFSQECWVWEFSIVVFQVCVSWPGRLAPRSYSHLGLHVGREVQCVPLQFCEGDGGVLQVVQEDLDLCHDIMGPDVCS